MLRIWDISRNWTHKDDNNNDNPRVKIKNITSASASNGNAKIIPGCAIRNNGMTANKPNTRRIKLAITTESGMIARGKGNCFNKAAFAGMDKDASCKEPDKKVQGRIPERTKR